jgi:hypothetical protein
VIEDYHVKPVFTLLSANLVTKARNFVAQIFGQPNLALQAA